MDNQQLLDEINDRLGLTDAPFESPDGCGLDFDGNLHIDAYYAADRDKLFLCAEVGSVYETEKPALLRTLLNANLAPATLADAHFALDAAANAITLSRTLPLDNQTADGVLQAIDALAATCRIWRDALAGQQLLLA